MTDVAIAITEEKIDKLINDLKNFPKLVKDPSKLKSVVQPKPMSQEDIDDITLKLKAGLATYGGVGLSANQLGLDARACIINVKEPLVLINPVVTEVSRDTVAYVEQSISLPKTMVKPIKTIRHKSFTLECDNLGTVVFSPDYVEGREWKDSDEFFGDSGLLECVIAQHQIDYLNGTQITDEKRRYTTTIVKSKSYGRNEMVMVKLADGSTEFIKYKKALQMGSAAQIL